MSVILRHPTHATEAGEFARLLVTIDRPEFGKAHGKIAIGTRLRIIDRKVMRTIHRLKQIGLVLHYNRGKLLILVIGIMSAGLVKLNVADVWRNHLIVAVFAQNL